MKTKLAIITIRGAITKKQNKQLRRVAMKRLGRGYRVLVMSGGAECQIIST
jgi:hypothetical protein